MKRNLGANHVDQDGIFCLEEHASFGAVVDGSDDTADIELYVDRSLERPVQDQLFRDILRCEMSS